MHLAELQAIDELKDRLRERAHDAAASAEAALQRGDETLYQQQQQIIEDAHTLLKALAVFVWSEAYRIHPHLRHKQ